MDFYQTDSDVVVTIFLKNQKQDEVSVDYSTESVRFEILITLLEYIYILYFYYDNSFDWPLNIQTVQITFVRSIWQNAYARMTVLSKSFRLR